MHHTTAEYSPTAARHRPYSHHASQQQPPAKPARTLLLLRGIERGTRLAAYQQYRVNTKASWRRLLGEERGRATRRGGE
jgi:hypothetical protein